MTDLVVDAPARVKLVAESSAPMTGIVGVPSGPVTPPTGEPMLDFSVADNSQFFGTYFPL